MYSPSITPRRKWIALVSVLVEGEKSRVEEKRCEWFNKSYFDFFFLEDFESKNEGFEGI